MSHKLPTRTSSCKSSYPLFRKCILAAGLILFSLTLWANPLDKASEAYESQDYEAAMKLYKQAAAQGHSGAQFSLGLMHAEGQGVPQNYIEAVKWYKLAASQGHSGAQFNLAVMYTLGRGIPQNYSEAEVESEIVKLYKLAASQGLETAQLNLGILYALGVGVPQSNVEAHMWINIAASKGSLEASKARDELSKRMTRKQIAEAQKLGHECLSKNFVGCI